MQGLCGELSFVAIYPQQLEFHKPHERVGYYWCQPKHVDDLSPCVSTPSGGKLNRRADLLAHGYFLVQVCWWLFFEEKKKMWGHSDDITGRPPDRITF